MVRTFALKSRTAGGGIDFRGDLNASQYAVATASGGPMLVIAGAGTGKTRALTYRLAWLISQGIDPSRILLATFTNRASKEMLHRVELLVKQETRRLWGGTFHHIANRLLRQYGDKLEIARDFTILDREDSQDLLATCVNEVGVGVHRRRFPKKAVLGSISSFVQNTLEALPTVVAKRYPMFLGEVEAIEKVLAQYVVRKRGRGLLDYDDLLGGLLRLLSDHGDVRETLAHQFQYVLVDEYQDTNAIQGAIVDILAGQHRNLCVVGDDSQSIYSFRGASFDNIISFKERYDDAQEFRLETNYRSTPEILALANRSIACNTRRLPKELQSLRPSGLKPAIVMCADENVQTQFIGEYVLHLLDEGRELLDIAVLYRSHWHSLEIQLELTRRNIPFRVRGGLRFFEQAHIKDILSYLRVLHNGRDEIAWMRMLRMLPRVGGALSGRLWQMIAPADEPLEAARRPEAARMFPSDARPFYGDLVKLLQRLQELSSPADIMEQVMDGFYEDYLVSHYDGGSLRAEDIRGLINFAGQYHTLEAFLSDLALGEDFSAETIVTGPEEQEFVVLSTVHQAKGLEWPVVMIPWLADGRFPTDLAVNTQEEEEEERRVFHVAVTRAKDELYLLVPQFAHFRMHGKVLMKPSRFLTEIDADVMEPLELETGLGHLTAGAEPTKQLGAADDRPGLVLFDSGTGKGQGK